VRAVLVAVFLGLISGAPALAQPAEGRFAPPAALLPGVGPDDPRRPVDPTALPWRALARVQTELGGRCTGAMVAPDRVLTAAHCLVARRSMNFVQPGSVHVLLGYHLGQAVAVARVKAYARGPSYAPPGGPIGADWAVLTLERPIAPPDRVLPLLRDPPPPGTPVMLGGYQRDRPEVLMADTGCRLTGLRHPAGSLPTLLHDCAGTRGSSGAPLLARRPDGQGWGVIGVASASERDAARGQAVPAATIMTIE
jgi:protease YdgD